MENKNCDNTQTKSISATQKKYSSKKIFFLYIIWKDSKKGVLEV